MAEIEVDARGSIRVDLSGGFLILTVNVNLSRISSEDRAFVLGVLDRVVTWASASAALSGSAGRENVTGSPVSEGAGDVSTSSPAAPGSTTPQGR